jgi:uncharacterized membrane protein
MTQAGLSRLEHQIGSVLRVGVALCASTLGTGLLLSFLGVSWAGRLMDVGLVLLMAIPVTRIVASFVDACRRRDGLLAWSTAFVLVVMAATLAFSLR